MACIPNMLSGNFSYQLWEYSTPHFYGPNGMWIFPTKNMVLKGGFQNWTEGNGFKTIVHPIFFAPNLQARTDVVHGLFRITKKHFHLGECPIWALGGEYLFQWWNTQNSHDSHGGTILRSQFCTYAIPKDTCSYMFIVHTSSKKKRVLQRVLQGTLFK